MARLFAAIVTSALLLFTTSAAAWADGDTSCDTDPPVVIVTPAGNLVPVYVVDKGPAAHLLSLLHPQISYTVNAVGGGQATNVKMTVVIPNDLLGSGYGVGTEVWSGLARTGA